MCGRGRSADVRSCSVSSVDTAPASVLLQSVKSMATCSRCQGSLYSGGASSIPALTSTPMRGSLTYLAQHTQGAQPTSAPTQHQLISARVRGLADADLVKRARSCWISANIRLVVGSSSTRYTEGERSTTSVGEQRGGDR